MGCVPEGNPFIPIKILCSGGVQIPKSRFANTIFRQIVFGFGLYSRVQNKILFGFGLCLCNLESRICIYGKWIWIWIVFTDNRWIWIWIWNLEKNFSLQKLAAL